MLAAGRIEVLVATFVEVGLFDMFFGAKTNVANAAILEILQFGLEDRSTLAEFYVLIFNDEVKLIVNLYRLTFFISDARIGTPVF